MPLPKRRGGESSARRPESEGPTRRFGSPFKRKPSEPEERPARRVAGGSSTSAGGGSTTGKGWGAVARRRAETASKKRGDDGKPAYLQRSSKFYLIDRETAVIQFINDEPLCVTGANIKSENYDFYVSPNSKSNPFTENGMKTIWKAGFKLLDYRGTWEKFEKPDRSGKKGDFKWDKAIEKYWLVSETIASQLEQFASKRGKPLSELVIEVTRTGNDKNTTYNFQVALDDDERALRPRSVREELPSLEEALEPLPKAEIEALIGGGVSGDYDDDDVDLD